jgi:HSP20 family protein
MLGKEKKKEIAPSQRGDVLTELQRDINRLFDDFGEDWPVFPSWGALSRGFDGDFAKSMAKMDVSENDDRLEVDVDLPGMNEKDIDVSLTPDAITIRGEKSGEKEEKRKDYVLRERSYGSFQRTIPLGGRFDVDAAKATFKNGVLTVKLPKTKEERAQRKKIDIKAE